MNFEYFGMSPVYWNRKRTEMYNSLSDECLVKVILDGDDSAFTQLYGRYRLLVCSVAGRIVRDLEEAQDATQEIFIKVYRSLHQWDVKKSKLSTWIYRLAVNHSIDCYRARLRRAESQLPQKNAERIFQRYARGGSACSPFKTVKGREEIRMVRRCIEKLPDLQKKTFIRRYFQELKLAEIAEIECCNLGTVKTSLYRATGVVRRILSKSNDLSLRNAEIQA
jgi:RNA polymerase sigma factor (sigma-70 family)